MGEGRVDGSVVDGCALEEERNTSRWPGIPEPLTSFNVPSSWHGNTKLRCLVVLLSHCCLSAYVLMISCMLVLGCGLLTHALLKSLILWVKIQCHGSAVEYGFVPHA